MLISVKIMYTCSLRIENPFGLPFVVSGSFICRFSGSWFAVPQDLPANRHVYDKSFSSLVWFFPSVEWGWQNKIMPPDGTLNSCQPPPPWGNEPVPATENKYPYFLSSQLHDSFTIPRPRRRPGPIIAKRGKSTALEVDTNYASSCCLMPQLNCYSIQRRKEQQDPSKPHLPLRRRSPLSCNKVARCQITLFTVLETLVTGGTPPKNDAVVSRHDELDTSLMENCGTSFAVI